MPEKYDDMSWHIAGDYPKDLPESAAATHIGLFLAWAILNGLGSEEHADDSAALRARQTMPGQYLIDACDGCLTEDDLSGAGNAFARSYLMGDDPLYLQDYVDRFEDYPTVYAVPDNWTSFAAIAPIIATRHADFMRGR